MGKLLYVAVISCFVMPPRKFLIIIALSYEAINKKNRISCSSIIAVLYECHIFDILFNPKSCR